MRKKITIKDLARLTGAELVNAEVLANPIVNYTRADRRRVDLPVGIPYETDTETARKAVLEAIENVPGIVTEPAAMVGFSSFGDSTLQLSTFFWIDMTKTNPLIAKDEALTRIKATLENRGVQHSLPAQIVYLQTQS